MTACKTNAKVSIVKRTTGPERKGKAMMQMCANRMKDSYRLFDLQDTIVPSAKDAEWPVCVCLHKTGSSGCLGPGASPRAMG